MILLSSFSCAAQIKLKGYKCKFYDGQWPHTMAEMCNSNDTFRFTLFSRDIWGETDSNDPKEILKAGLKVCFEGDHYITTKDSLFIATGKSNGGIYYKIYVPNKHASLSVRAKNNNALFAQRSEWLLSQVRLHRFKDIYLINEKGQTCQNPNEPEH